MESLKTYVLEKLPSQVTEASLAYRELTLHTTPQHLIGVLLFLRDDGACLFQQLMDICGVDTPQREKRFDVVYHLLSLRKNQRIRVKIQVEEEEAVPTCTGIFKAAGWWEREAWDMFGIPFSGHPDLRRILTDYGFQGFPLRKDFPLTGYHEVRYDEERKAVIYEPVLLQQQFRTFDFMSPWEGTAWEGAETISPSTTQKAGEPGNG